MPVRDLETESSSDSLGVELNDSLCDSVNEGDLVALSSSVNVSETEGESLNVRDTETSFVGDLVPDGSDVSVCECESDSVSVACRLRLTDSDGVAEPVRVADSSRDSVTEGNDPLEDMRVEFEPDGEGTDLLSDAAALSDGDEEVDFV